MFAAHLRRQSRQSSNVATWSRKTCDEPAADRIGILRHDNRNRRSCFLHTTGYRRTTRDDEVDFETHELGGKLAAALDFSFCRAPFDDDVLTLNVSELAETLAECLGASRDSRSRRIELKSYTRNLRRLLRLAGWDS